MAPDDCIDFHMNLFFMCAFLVKFNTKCNWITNHSTVIRCIYHWILSRDEFICDLPIFRIVLLTFVSVFFFFFYSIHRIFPALLQSHSSTLEMNMWRCGAMGMTLLVKCLKWTHVQHINRVTHFLCCFWCYTKSTIQIKR